MPREAEGRSASDDGPRGAATAEASPVCRQSVWRLMAWDQQLPRDLVERLWRHPDALIDQGTVVSPGRRCTVVRLVWPSAGTAAAGDRRAAQQFDSLGRFAVTEGGPMHLSDGIFAIKRFNRKGPLHTMTHWLLPTRAWRGWRLGRWLRQQGVPTPWPRALVENRFGPLRGTSYLLTEYVAGEPLQRWIDREEGHSAAEWEHVAAQFAALWRRMGDLRVIHGDMKGTNFLIDQDRRLWMIDLDAARRPVIPWVFSRARRRDWNRFLQNFGPRCRLIELFEHHVQSAG